MKKLVKTLKINKLWIREEKLKMMEKLVKTLKVNKLGFFPFIFDDLCLYRICCIALGLRTVNWYPRVQPIDSFTFGTQIREKSCTNCQGIWVQSMMLTFIKLNLSVSSESYFTFLDSKGVLLLLSVLSASSDKQIYLGEFDDAA